MKKGRKGRPGVARKLAEKPDATRRLFAEHCACGAVLSEAGQELAKEYDHIDIPPIRPITTRVELFRATCPCCKARVTASAPADMPSRSLAIRRGSFMESSSNRRGRAMIQRESAALHSQRAAVSATILFNYRHRV